MTIKVAETAGFCFGVRRAMELALHSSHRKLDKGVYTWGPLVHNRQAVEILRDRGILPAGNLDDIEDELVLIRAHGIPPQERRQLEEKSYEIIDATCPHVRRAQKLAAANSARGYSVVIVGDKGHPEVTGILGSIEDSRAFVVENIDQAQQLPPELDKVCVVAQTTQSGELFEPIVELIKNRYPDVKVFNTVCGATNQRQREVRELAREVDAMIVIGGYHSANTNRLAEVSKECGVPTFHIETAQELDYDTLRHYTTIGVTAGASTPHWVIRNVVERLREFEERQLHLPERIALSLARFIVYSQLLLAIGAAGLTCAVQTLFSLPLNIPLIVLSALYVLSMHILNRYLTLPREETLLYGMLRYFARHQRLMWFMWVISASFALVISASFGWLTFVLVTVSLLLGALYSLAIIPRGWMPGLRYRRLRDIPGSKDLFTAGAWTMVIVVIPLLTSTYSITPAGLIAGGLVVLILALTRSLLYDIRDIEGDIILGRETIPLLLGLRMTRRVILTVQAILASLLIVFYITGIFSAFSLLMLLAIAYITIASTYKRQLEFYQSLGYDALIDGQFIIAGLLAFLWRSFT